MIFHEVYIGKNKDILAMERQLGKYRSKYMSSNIIKRNNAYYDEDLRKFERMVEDFFGFDCFELMIEDVKMGNAFTYPLGMKFDVINPKKMVISNSKGFKFKKEAKYAGIVCVYSGLMFNKEFTDEEIMSVILHEIGHNFQSALNEQVGILTGYHKALLIPALFLQVIKDPTQIFSAVGAVVNATNFFQRVDTKLTRHLVDTNPIFKFAGVVCNRISDIITNLKLEVNSLANASTLGLLSVVFALYGSFVTIMSMILNPIVALTISLPIKTKDRMGEQIADNFATIYGYGPASARVTTKLQDGKSANLLITDKAMSNIPVLGKLYQMNKDIALIILMQFDEHPQDINRISSQIAMLENELQRSNLKPEMKKRIQNDLKILKKDTNAYLQAANNLNDDKVVYNLYSKFLAENSSGKLKEYLDGKAQTPLSDADEYKEKDMFNQYDDIFNKVYVK